MKKFLIFLSLCGIVGCLPPNANIPGITNQPTQTTSETPYIVEKVSELGSMEVWHIRERRTAIVNIMTVRSYGEGISMVKIGEFKLGEPGQEP